MLSVLLDTHIWLWWITGAPSFDANVRAALDQVAANHLPCISATSLWEAQMLVAKGRIQPAKHFDLWIRRIASPEIVVTLPFDIDVICALRELPKSFHGDPADRLIVATARAHDMPLATHDTRIRNARLIMLWKPQARPT